MLVSMEGNDAFPMNGLEWTPSETLLLLTDELLQLRTSDMISNDPNIDLLVGLLGKGSDEACSEIENISQKRIHIREIGLTTL